MLKINITILDEDIMFLNQLSRYMLDKTDRFTISSFSEPENFLNYVEYAKVDVILFTEKFEEYISDKMRATKIIMTEGIGREGSKFYSVNKYQKAEDFLKELLMIYAEDTGNSSVVLSSDKNSYMIGLYSPVGGSGKTTLAVALAKMLAGSGAKVLYLNLEEISSVSKVFNDQSDKGFSDIMLAAKRKDKNLPLKIIANTSKDNTNGIYYINPPESAVEFSEMSDEEIFTIVNELNGTNEFDYVVADIIGAFNNRAFGLMKMCKKIVIPMTESTLSSQKIELFIKEIRLLGYENTILKKSVFVLNRAQRNAPEDFLKKDLKNMTIQESEKYLSIENILNSNEYDDDIGRLIALMRD